MASDPLNIIRDYLVDAPEQGDWAWEDHCDGLAGGILVALKSHGLEVWPAGDRTKLEAKLDAALTVASESFRDALTKNTLGESEPSICDELGIEVPEGTANYLVQTMVIDRIKRLEEAILDIDAHAAPIGEDEDGFVSVGYTVSVGAIHRALGVVGRTAPKRGRIRPEAGDRTPVTREQVRAVVVRWYVGDGELDPTSSDDLLDVDGLTDSVMALLSGQSPTEERDMTDHKT